MTTNSDTTPICPTCGAATEMLDDGTHLDGPGPGQTVYTLGRGGPFKLAGRPARWCGDRAAAAAKNEALRVEREARWAKERAEREAREDAAEEARAVEIAARPAPLTFAMDWGSPTRAILRDAAGETCWESETRWYVDDDDPLPDDFEAGARAEADAFATRLRRHGATVAWEA